MRNQLCSRPSHLSTLQLSEGVSLPPGPSINLLFDSPPQSLPSPRALGSTRVGFEPQVKSVIMKYRVESGCQAPRGRYANSPQAQRLRAVLPPAPPTQSDFCSTNPQGEFLPRQGVCVSTQTIPDMHCNFSKDASSAEPDKCADTNSGERVYVSCRVLIGVDSNIPPPSFPVPFLRPWPVLSLCFILMQNNRNKRSVPFQHHGLSLALTAEQSSAK